MYAGFPGAGSVRPLQVCRLANFALTPEWQYGNPIKAQFWSAVPNGVVAVQVVGMIVADGRTAHCGGDRLAGYRCDGVGPIGMLATGPGN
jgi:hypothetical protein